MQPDDIVENTSGDGEFYDEDFDYEAYAAALEGEDWSGTKAKRSASRCSPWSAGPTSGSRPWSTASSAAAKRWSRTSRRDPRPRVVRRALERPPLHPGGHRRLGAGRGGNGRGGRLPGRGGDQHRRRGDVRGGRHGGHHGHRRGGGPRPPQGEQAGDPGREQGRRPAGRGRAATLWNLGLGEPFSVSALPRPRQRRPPGRRPDALPETPRVFFGARWAVRGAWPWSASPTSANPAS